MDSALSQVIRALQGSHPGGIISEQTQPISMPPKTMQEQPQETLPGWLHSIVMSFMPHLTPPGAQYPPNTQSNTGHSSSYLQSVSQTPSQGVGNQGY